MERVYNFSAGPSMLPEQVLKQAAAEMLSELQYCCNNVRVVGSYEKEIIL